MDERRFKELADAWTRVEGEKLNAQNSPAWREATPRLDALVKRGTARSAARRALRWASLAAACLVIITGAWMALRLNPIGGTPSGATPSDHAAAPTDDGQAADNIADALPPAATSGPGTDSEPDEAATKVMELAFVLPVRFTVAGVEEDNGVTIYTLADTMHDDVVLSMERGDPPAPEGMRMLDIGGTPCYVTSNADYNVLSFGKDGITYRLSCRYDINTLAGLAAHII